MNAKSIHNDFDQEANTHSRVLIHLSLKAFEYDSCLLTTNRLLITAPRRSSAIPNENGRYALFTVSTYSLESHSETLEIKVLNLESGQTTLFSNDESHKSPQWLVGDQILWLKATDEGETQLWVGTAGGEDKR